MTFADEYEALWGDEPEGEAYDDEERYYLHPYTVTCSLCGRSDVLTHAECDRKGWALGAKEFCPPCAVQEKLWDAAITVGRARALIERIEREDGGKRIKLKKGANIPCPF